MLPSLILCTHPNLGSPIGKQFPWPHIDWSSSHAPMLLRVLATCCRFRVSNECRRWENGRAFELQPCLDADQATLQTIQYQRSKPLKNQHVYILDPHRLIWARWDDHPFAHSPSWLPTPRFHRQLTWTPPALLLSGLSGRTLIEIISDDIICLMVTLWPWGQTTYIPLYLGTFENSQIELEHFFISKVAKNKIFAFHWSPRNLTHTNLTTAATKTVVLPDVESHFEFDWCKYPGANILGANILSANILGANILVQISWCELSCPMVQSAIWWNQHGLSS